MEKIPLPNNQAELISEIMAMQNDYDDGLREFQEAIDYCIFHMFVNGGKNTSRKKAVQQVLYLKDLSDRLRKLEALLKSDSK